ncbi:MAG: hypothetical protein VX654_10785, partial [Chloroflexota bacterium]|nr:hypothetical protein [Chloroflexota bacterium]
HKFPSGCPRNYRRPVASISVLYGSHWSSSGRADWVSIFGIFLKSGQKNDKYKNLLKFAPNSIDGYVYKLVLSVAIASACKRPNGGVHRIFSDISTGFFR